MTAPFDRLVERVSRIEATPVAGPNGYTAISHKRDRRGERATQRAGIVTATVRFPGVTARTPVTAYATHEWSSSYSTGGESVSPALDTLVPGFLNAFPSPVNGYTFKYDSGTDKLLAYESFGVEVGAASDLGSLVGTTPIMVVGRGETILDAYTAAGNERIIEATLYTTAGCSASGTAYWEIEARVKSAGDSYGSRFGRRLSTSSVGLTAGESYRLLGDPETEELTSGDRVVLYAAASSASTTTLGDLTLVLKIQREVL